MRVKFTTTDSVAAAARADIADFRFRKTRLDRQDGITGLALHDDRMFACTWDGKLIVYRLGDDGEMTYSAKVLLAKKRRFNAIAVDPSSSADATVLWLSHDSQQGLSLGPNDFSGTLSRLTISTETVNQRDVVVGLPTGDHPASGLA